MRKVIPASADGNIEFSGKIGPLWVSTSVCDGIQTDEIVDSVAKFTGVDQFMFIDSGERITDHVSHTVEGGLEGCLISGMEAINDIRSVLNLDTTKLNVLSSCNVDDTTFTVLFDALGVKSHLLRVNDAIGCLEAHHELTGRSLVSVKHADVFNTRVDISFLHFVPCHFTFSNLSGVFVDVDPCVDGIIREFDLLGGVSLLAPFHGFFWEERSTSWLVHNDGSSDKGSRFNGFFHNYIFFYGTEDSGRRKWLDIAGCECECRRQDDGCRNSCN
mmetsp:Transcript_6404/g.15541  ORF Transcript_6404/g.15541 Transcript_6404/m.15541 type:complete len:273 (+) Transcript_6404:1074-1892(+)